MICAPQDVWIVVPDKADEKSQNAMSALIQAMGRNKNQVTLGWRNTRPRALPKSPSWDLSPCFVKRRLASQGGHPAHCRQLRQPHNGWTNAYDERACRTTNDSESGHAASPNWSELAAPCPLQLAIVRFVPRDNTPPKLHAASPMPAAPGRPACLLLNELPFLVSNI